MKVKVKYEKPTLQKVKLVPSEAVLSACKTRGAFGPQAPVSCNLDAGVFCQAVGS